MSKNKITVYAEIKPRGDWQTEGQIKANYQDHEMDEEGRILIRHKEDKTGIVQKVADTLAAIIFFG